MPPRRPTLDAPTEVRPARSLLHEFATRKRPVEAQTEVTRRPLEAMSATVVTRRSEIASADLGGGGGRAGAASRVVREEKTSVDLVAAELELGDLIEMPRSAPRERPLPGMATRVSRAPAPKVVAPPLRSASQAPSQGHSQAPSHPPSQAPLQLPPRPPARPLEAREKSAVRRLFHSVVTVIPGLKRLSEVVAPAPNPPPVEGDSWGELRALPILAGMPDEALAAALACGELGVVVAGRDDLLDVAGRALLVGGGQVALARFDGARLDGERAAQAAFVPGDKKAAKKERKRRLEVGPLIELAERNLVFFEQGDLIDLKLGRDDDGGAGAKGYACYAVTPARVIFIARPRLEAWKREYSPLADRLRRASQAARARLDALVGAREEVADFFIRHGLSIAQTLRVRQIDKCVECGSCEAACEERYGAKRLSLNGNVLGGLDFVSACHTCTDQRCIDPCAFDAIKYDVARREIVIIEAACTGCTLCATACPYHAIEMHDLEDKPLLELRLSREGSLGFGDGTARKAKLKRMASKCDHCITYEDQACIAACPTGALFEVAPADVFHARPEAARAQAQSGFDHSVLFDTRMLLDAAPFSRGLDEKIDRSRVRRPRIWTAWMWTVGLCAWLGCLLEIALREIAPAHSIDYLYQTLVDGLEPEIALGRVDYRPGCELAVRLGYVGAVILLGSLVYPARRRLALLRDLGAQRAWFDMHVLCGVIGPLFILLHTAAKLDNWVSLAFWSLVGTVASGLLGRYLTTQLPEWASVAALATHDVSRSLADLRARHISVRAADDWRAAHQRRVAEIALRSSPRILAFLVADDLDRLLGRRALASRLHPIADRRDRNHARRLAARLALYERRRVLLPRLEPLFRRWKWVHVPLAIALTVIGGIHILLALL